MSSDFSGATDLDRQLQQLVNQSVQTLADILSDTSLAPGDRAAVALQILALAKGQVETASLPDLTAIAQTLDRASASPDPISPTDPPHDFTPPRLDRYCCLDNFLSGENNQYALDIALNQRHEFVPSSTTTQAENYRQSSILYATRFPKFYHFLKGQILQVFPQVLRQIQHPPFSVRELEMQLTAHGDGCYYKVHNDSGSPATQTRELTYVYYVHREPLRFSGGELRLYHTDPHNGRVVDREQYTEIAPHNNRIVFFDSRCQHEVMPVRCPSHQFEDGRLTFNGWLRR